MVPVNFPVSNPPPAEPERSFFCRKISSYFVKKVKAHAKEISYIATILAIAAFAAALFSNQFLFGFLVLGSALLFRLSIWSFISKERWISEQLREQNSSLQLSLDEARGQIETQERHKEQLKGENQMLEIQLGQLKLENEEFQQAQRELASVVEENRVLKDKLKQSIEKAAIIQQKVALFLKLDSSEKSPLIKTG